MARKQLPNLWNSDERENAKSCQISPDFRRAKAAKITKYHSYKDTQCSSGQRNESKGVEGPKRSSATLGQRVRGEAKGHTWEEPALTVPNPAFTCSKKLKTV